VCISRRRVGVVAGGPSPPPPVPPHALARQLCALVVAPPFPPRIPVPFPVLGKWYIVGIAELSSSVVGHWMFLCTLFW
jgi:hypothetical protein